MAQQHPLGGVGLDNFVVVAPESMRDVAPLETSYLIVRTPPDQVHNLYLQALAESGVVGLVLLALFLGACVRAANRAAQAALETGVLAERALSLAVMLALCSFLATSAFLSSGVDKRLWLLLALAGSLQALAWRLQDGAAAVPADDGGSRP